MDRLKRMARKRANRAFRVRRKLRGVPERPRLSVHRTSKHIYAQIVDDLSGRTLCSASSLALKLEKGGNVGAAVAVGAAIGEKAKEAGITRVGFDRGATRYMGRVKALADAVRKVGIEF
jgi:large subunit ribosomal protein L18